MLRSVFPSFKTTRYSHESLLFCALKELLSAIVVHATPKGNRPPRDWTIEIAREEATNEAVLHRCLLNTDK